MIPVLLRKPLPFSLCVALTSRARLHFYEQCAVFCIASKKYEVSHTGQHAFCLQFPSRDLVTPAAVWYGEQAVAKLWVLDAEPADTRTLYAVLLVAGSATRLDTGIGDGEHLVESITHFL